MRYKLDLIPVAVVGLSVALSLLPLFFPLPVAGLAGIWALILFLKNATLCAQHNHGHLSVFAHRWLNFAYDTLLAQATGYGTPEWELQHNRGHHRHFLDPARDVASPVDPVSRANMSRPYYIWQGFLRIFPDAWVIARAAGQKGQPRLLRRLLLHAGLQMALTLLWLVIDPAMALVFIVIPNLIGRAMVWWGSYWHHLDMPRTSIYDGAATYPNRFFNLVSFNSGYHTAHHEQPALHWSLLAHRTKAIRERIPDRCFVERV